MPHCVRILPCTPLVSFSYIGDIASCEILWKFGKEFEVPSDEIDHICNLASGLLDVVVILERPQAKEMHNYRLPVSHNS
jgi:hypothetical protein